MERATQRLENDGETEIELLKERAKQGYMGMAAGFILGLLFTGMALFLVYTDRSWPGLSLIGVYIGIALAVSIYISKAQLRRKFYTGIFSPVFSPGRIAGNAVDKRTVNSEEAAHDLGKSY